MSFKFLSVSSSSVFRLVGVSLCSMYWVSPEKFRPCEKDDAGLELVVLFLNVTLLSSVGECNNCVSVFIGVRMGVFTFPFIM